MVKIRSGFYQNIEFVKLSLKKCTFIFLGGSFVYYSNMSVDENIKI